VKTHRQGREGRNTNRLKKIHAYWEKIFQEQQFDEFLCIIYERQNAEHQLL